MKLRRIMKAQSPKKKKKERNNNNNNNKRLGPRLGQAKGHATRTLMCPFEALRRGPWLTYEKAKVNV